MISNSLLSITVDWATCQASARSSFRIRIASDDYAEFELGSRAKTARDIQVDMAFESTWVARWTTLIFIDD